MSEQMTTSQEIIQHLEATHSSDATNYFHAYLAGFMTSALNAIANNWLTSAQNPQRFARETVEICEKVRDHFAQKEVALSPETVRAFRELVREVTNVQAD